MKNCLSLVVFLLVLLSVSVSARDWYVNNQAGNCDDSGAGTLAVPLCTISSANTRHAGGDTVYIMPGEYREAIFPKSGIDDEHRTVYSGYGIREQVKIFGSVEVTGWTKCAPADPNCAGVSTSVWYATMPVVPQTRGTHYEEDIPEYDCTYYNYGEGSSRNFWNCNKPSTDCWQGDDNWFTKSDWLAGESTYQIGADASTINSQGEMFYDTPTNLIYVWPFNNANPNSEQMDCSVIRPAPWVMAYLSAYAPAGYSDPSNIIVKNLSIKHSLQNGITLGEQGDNIKISNTEISYSAGPTSCGSNIAAIITHRYGNTDYTVSSTYHKNVVFTQNKIHHMGNDYDGLGGGSRQGIELYHTDGATLSYNEIYEVANGIYIKSGNSGARVFGNTIHDAYIGIQSQYFDQEHTFYDNLFYDMTGPCINPDHNNRNHLVVHNTCHAGSSSASGAMFFHDSGVIESTRFANNIFPASSEEVIFNIENPITEAATLFDYQLYTQDSSFNPRWNGHGPFTSLENWRSGTSLDTHSMIADPMFVDESSGNFRLLEGSPAIDAGLFIPGFHCEFADGQGGESMTGCRHWTGDAPDIGAFESEFALGLPSLSDVACYEGTTWVSCDTLAYGDSLNQVRASCISSEHSITGVTFKLEGLADSYTYFDSPGAFGSGLWTLDNVDALLDDSGPFRLTATCTDSEGLSSSRVVSWSLPWGVLSVEQVAPLGDVEVTSGQSFSYSTTLTCAGGECGSVTAVLDPLLSVGKTASASSFRSGEGPENAIDGNTAGGRWVSEMDAPPVQWMMVDLEDVYLVDNVVLYWDHAFGEGYDLQVSELGSSWSTVFSETSGDGGQDDVAFTPVNAKYVRLSLNDYGSTEYDVYTLFEFEVYGTNSTGSTYKGVVAENSGSPFYTTSSNPQTCADMKAGSTCSNEWDVMPAETSGSYTFFVDYDAINANVEDIRSDYISVTISESACTIPYDLEPCDEIDFSELIAAINGWFASQIEIPTLIEIIRLWKEG